MPAKLLRLGALAAAVAAWAPTASLGATANPLVDRVFAEWDRPGSPGCALAVTRADSVVYARGYGSANLELDSPITPHSVFDIGSVSKQFTAMSVLLLAQDGKLSLDDDVHKFIPELPAYGPGLTLRTLLHHLSGLRSYTDLFDLAGVPEIDQTTDADALALIARQKTLNFPPGRQYLYSDTNYFLLALVVRRVSGETLRVFAQRRIFGPLGMKQTHFHDDHRMIVPHRATGYAPHAGGGFDIDMSNFEELGDGSVMTTVLDMARWDRNFDVPVVGGTQAIALMQELGVRSDGSPSPYAMGLILDDYRGIARVQHTGEWVGYRSSFLRFPTRRLSVILLCNVVGDLDALALSERVADVYLGQRAPDRLPRHAISATGASRGIDASGGTDGSGGKGGSESKGGSGSTAGSGDSGAADFSGEPKPGGAAQFEAYAGTYWNPETFAYLRFVAHAGALSLADDAGARPLIPRGKGAFQAANSTTRYTFHTADGAMTVDAKDDDSDVVRLERVSADRLPVADLGDFTGTYYNDELGVSWRLDAEDGRLIRTQWGFPGQALAPVFADTFTGDLSEGAYALQFARDAAGRVDGFSVGTTMVRPLRFRRCMPAKPDDGGPVAMGCKTSVDGVP